MKSEEEREKEFITAVIELENDHRPYPRALIRAAAGLIARAKTKMMLINGLKAEGFSRKAFEQLDELLKLATEKAAFEAYPLPPEFGRETDHVA